MPAICGRPAFDSQDYIAEALNRYPAIAAAMFVCSSRGSTRLPARTATSPPSTSGHDRGALRTCRASTRTASSGASSTSSSASLRTNYFAPAREERGQSLAFKLDSRRVDGLPAPRPFREIFVFGAEVEGVHLRFGPVARGGLRWSDRAQDYRTEVLGLVKAQQVKNAVIVPVGAKGGFFPKRSTARPQPRRDLRGRPLRLHHLHLARCCRSPTISTATRSCRRQDMVRLDGDDPYFVVAADKGTATFSDTANAIGQAHGFWLDDAFASGGSAGYDHKKMGITARGAWEAVKRHFREMNRDIQTTPFTVVGVGDMSGDVFGNGMLLSPPDPADRGLRPPRHLHRSRPGRAASMAERQRLFDMPRSGWQDYDKALISAGGMIISRARNRSRCPRRQLPPSASTRPSPRRPRS